MSLGTRQRKHFGKWCRSAAWRCAGVAGVLVMAVKPCSARQCDPVWESLAGQPSGPSNVVFDTARQVLVWHERGTWESATGDTWTLRTSAGPGPGYDGMVFDEARQVTILFHGYSYGTQAPETWQWDGQSWTLLTNEGPSTRDNASLTYDSARGRVIMFGGTYKSVDYNDTWAWDGAAWTQLDSGQTMAPTGRELAGLAYDSARDRVVLFGGDSGSPPYRPGDTWEFDGTGWTLAATTGPGGRASMGMAYDPARQLTVMYGGYLGVMGPVGDTWEWDGAQWISLAPASAPGTRLEHGMTFHPGLGRVVSVGGTNSNTARPEVRTWQWTGTTWDVVGTPPQLPDGRWMSAMTYDSQRERIVMYGGNGPSGTLADTWEFDGATWLWRSASGPGPRAGHCMAYDSLRDVTVLFGGASNSETWEWNGAQWALAAATGPAARSFASMDFDSDRGVCVMFGGAGDASTWEWDGSNWTSITAPGPSPRSLAAMAYDSLRHRSFLFGGTGGSLTEVGDFWAWSGTDWTQYPAGPPARRWHVLAFDSDRGKLVLFGGRRGRDVFPSILGDTWEHDGSLWTQVNLVGPGARSGSCMAYDAARRQMVLFGGESNLYDDTWLYRMPVSDPVLLIQPVDRATALRGAVSFAVVAGGGGSLTYQWRRDNVDLSDNSRIYGSRSAVLSINPAETADAGVYEVVVSNGCVSVTSAEAVLSVSRCSADFNADDIANSQDFFDYLLAFFGGSMSADFDGSGLVDSADFFAFLGVFLTGCT